MPRSERNHAAVDAALLARWKHHHLPSPKRHPNCEPAIKKVKYAESAILLTELYTSVGFTTSADECDLISRIGARPSMSRPLGFHVQI